MPQDLYQWEDGGGLVHHCPKCQKPLTTPQARSRCLGEHVEWCTRYHTQLFKKGTSGQCAPCRNGDEQRTKRHREIAELVQKLEVIDAPTPATPLTPRNMNALASTDDEPSPSTKKERKAAKKAKKISAMPKVVNSAMIEHVGKILHPKDDEGEDEELEAKLLNDADINLNRFFHRGTSNQREVRNVFVKKDRRDGKFHVEEGELKGLLQLLNVSPVTANTTTEAKKTIELLKEKIEADLLQMHDEIAGTMMRKAGFWRWASKKAYNRLVANGRIWGDKDAAPGAAKPNASDDNAEGDADADTDTGQTDGTVDTEITDPDTDADAASSSVDALVASTAEMAIDTPTTPTTPTTAASPAGKEEQTSVNGNGMKKSSVRKPAPAMSLKLSHNGGLTKLAQSTTPKSARVLSFPKKKDE